MIVRSLAVVVLVSAGCSATGSDATPTASVSADQQLQTASRGLCDALGLADRDDVPGAARKFYDEAHAFLHDLARRLETFDREAAGDLLVAKQRLEAAIADPETADPREVRDLIARLRGELRSAAEAAGLPRPTCEAAA